jgi:hypothetical protein
LANITNPKLTVKIIGDTDIEIEDLHMDFDITKDLSEEPNTCDLSVYNLGPDLRGQIEAIEHENAPIELRATYSGGTDLMLLYAGEITDVYSEFLRPGHITRITCESQKANHREFDFDKEFAAGTAQSEIITQLITAVGLPTGPLPDWPTGTLLLSHTFSGPAFNLLQKYVFDMGFKAVITDGVLTFSTPDVVQDFSVYKITPEILLGDPRTSSRTDSSEIEMRTVVESYRGDIDPFKKIKKRQRKTKKKRSLNDYVEYDAVETIIPGVTMDMLLQPTLIPDQIIKVDMPGYNKYYRTQIVRHSGDTGTYQNWDTEIEADIYDDTDGDITE